MAAQRHVICKFTAVVAGRMKNELWVLSPCVGLEAEPHIAKESGWIEIVQGHAVRHTIPRVKTRVFVENMDSNIPFPDRKTLI